MRRFLPLSPLAAKSAKTSLGLRFDLWHKMRASGDEMVDIARKWQCHDKATGQARS